MVDRPLSAVHLVSQRGVARELLQPQAPGLEGIIGLARLLILLSQKDIGLRELRLGRQVFLLVNQRGKSLDNFRSFVHLRRPMGQRGGIAWDPCYLLTSTNVAAGLSGWSRLGTNYFDVTGATTFTNAIAPGEPGRFYLLQVN